MPRAFERSPGLANPARATQMYEAIAADGKDCARRQSWVPLRRHPVRVLQRGWCLHYGFGRTRNVLAESRRRAGAVIMADSSEPTREEKIADALRAAPAYLADSATVVDSDMTTVLREGSPDWTCVPTPPGTPRRSDCQAGRETLRVRKRVLLWLQRLRPRLHAVR
jgi:hypothetical protein